MLDIVGWRPGTVVFCIVYGQKDLVQKCLLLLRAVFLVVEGRSFLEKFCLISIKRVNSI